MDRDVDEVVRAFFQEFRSDIDRYTDKEKLPKGGMYPLSYTENNARGWYMSLGEAVGRFRRLIKVVAAERRPDISSTRLAYAGQAWTELPRFATEVICRDLMQRLRQACPELEAAYVYSASRGDYERFVWEQPEPALLPT